MRVAFFVLISIEDIMASDERDADMNAKRAARRIIMAGGMKRFVEDVSVDMGLAGEINDEVTAEAQRRLDTGQPQDPSSPPKKTYEA